MAYSRLGASGILFAKLIERLGIASDINAKAQIIPQGFTAEKLVTGEADLAVQQISELKQVGGIEVVGPIPYELQTPAVFSAGRMTATNRPPRRTGCCGFSRRPRSRRRCARAAWRPFDFTVGLNRAAVDFQGVEKSSKLADALAHDATIGRDVQMRAAAPPKGFQRKTPIVAEGDSWFRLPHLIMPPTLVDLLQQTYGYPITNMAHWGDTLADMILAGQFWPPLVSGQADTFLFSGGGNDVLGGESGIARFLRLLRCRSHQAFRCGVLHQA